MVPAIRWNKETRATGSSSHGLLAFLESSQGLQAKHQTVDRWWLERYQNVLHSNLCYVFGVRSFCEAILMNALKPDSDIVLYA